MSRSSEKIPNREAAVLGDPVLRATLLRGLAQAADGRTVTLGSFARYLDDADYAD